MIRQIHPSPSKHLISLDFITVSPTQACLPPQFENAVQLSDVFGMIEKLGTRLATWVRISLNVTSALPLLMPKPASS